VLHHLAISAAALLVVWLYPQSLVLLLGSQELTAWAPQIALVVFLFVFSSMAETIVTAYQDVKASTFFIVGANLTRTALLTGAVLVCPTIEVILNAAIVQALLQSVAILWYLNRRFPQFWKKLDGSLLREQLAYAVPLGFSGVLAIVQRDIHQFYVSVTFGSAAYAVYAIGCFQLPLIGLIRDSVASVVISRTSEYQQEGRIADIIRLTAQGMRKLSLVYWPSLMFLIVWAKEFVVVLFTKTYIDSVPLFQLNMLVLLLAIPITDSIYRAFAEYKYFIVRVRLVLLIVVLALLHFGIRQMGMPGAITVALGGTIAERLVIGWKCARILNMTRSDFRMFAGSITAGIAAIGALLPAYLVHLALGEGLHPAAVLLVCGTTYAGGYGGLLYVCGFIEPDEHAAVAGLVAKVRRRFGKAEQAVSRAA
jgi:O-antigen/teichoic acid export membrane protein